MANGSLYRVTAAPSLRLRESAPYGRILANMPTGAIVRGAPTSDPAWLAVAYTPPNGLPIAGVTMTQYTALLPAFPLAFDFPVGAEEERAAAIDGWPGEWTDATGYAKLYNLPGRQALPGEQHYHTGADLNLNVPAWDGDKGRPVLAIAAGTVTYAGALSQNWGQTIVIRHDFPNGARCYSRYSALAALAVSTGDQVTRSQPIAAIGSHKPGEPHHLHFDISLSAVLATAPGDWPGPDWSRVIADYVAPLPFLLIHKAAPGAPDDGRELDPTFAALVEAVETTAEELAQVTTAYNFAMTTHRQAVHALMEFCL